MATDYQEAIRILSEQEKILQFDSFTSEDAWKLGNIMVEEIRNQGINLTVSIRKMNGHIVFAYASEGANLNHQNWTDRKFNMVSYMECSSLLATARAHFLGRSLVEDFGLNYEEYKLCGGGSPTNGYPPTTTLGCGSWGNNSFSGNFNYEHLMNITRVGYPYEESYLPDPAKAWD